MCKNTHSRTSAADCLVRAAAVGIHKLNKKRTIKKKQREKGKKRQKTTNLRQQNHKKGRSDIFLELCVCIYMAITSAL